MGIEASLFSLGANLLGSALESDATEDAAKEQSGATRDATGEQRRQYDLTRADYAPWREAGGNALARLMQEINRPTTQADVMQDPGYLFGLQEGQKALDRHFARAGGRVSGAAMKAAARYGTDYGATGYNAAYQRRQDMLNRLAAVAGLGQTATAGTAVAGGQAANSISALLANQGDNAGAARLARGSIWGNAISRAASRYGQGTGEQPLTWGAPSYGSGNWSPGVDDGFYTDPMGGY